MKDLLSIVSHFQLTGTVQEIKPLGAGLINDTYKVTTLEADAPDYVLQRINHAIFQDVEMLQANINAVTTHIRRKLEEKVKAILSVRCSISFLPAMERLIGSTAGITGVSWRLFPMRGHTKRSIPNIHTMPVRLSATSRPCLPIFPTVWVRQSPISTIWNSV